MKMSRKSILLFFQVQSLQNQYRELFPYDELLEDFRIREFGCKKKFTNDINNLELNVITRKIHAFLQNCELRRKKFTTIAYLDRVNGYYPSKSSLQHIKIRSFEKKNILERVATSVFSNYGGAQLLRQIVNFLFKLESIFRANTLKKFDIFILPYTGGISVEVDFLFWLSRVLKIKSIAIQENWDNLSSKQFLLYYPSTFLVWGNQSGSHLRTYHHYEGIVREAGCLRLQGLYKKRQWLSKAANLGAVSQIKYQILFIDTGVINGDLEILHGLSKYFEKNLLLSEKYKIIYRTHPRFNETDLRKEFIAKVQKLPHIHVFVPDILESNESRIQQIAESSLIISIFSTYVLEGSILDRICLVPTFSMDFNKFSPHKLIDDLTHFHGISMLTRVKTVTSFDELMDNILRFEKNNTQKLNDPVLLDWFCRDINTQEVIINSIYESESS